ncbi:hypothetical protein PILCRDRAFT_203 [Piloderma croceum F 1598]|uniref:CCHC-type domain-containing protein n=1 Tax=Piloderma croceum (strain F 1598) TaxID=765440 RepID=A0A0C3CR09_PILCF|nr:hypothetical protein PILCRDRAFT_203 [Piloderma croceum F 1598]
MSNLMFNSNSDSTNLAVPKLRDDGSNWSDYEPRIQKAMGSKGLWRHIQGTAIAPKPYAIVNGIPVLPDGKSEATEEQVEAKETRIIEFDNAVLGTSSSKKMKADDLIAFFIEEAQHRVINDERTKSAESALAAHGKKGKKGKGGQGKKPEKSESDELCDNCNRPGHTKPNCWSKGGGKEGQGPRQKKSKKGEKKDETAAVA